MNRCLFSIVNKCNDGESSEHVIPRSLGGTIESKDVICEECNHFFGEKIDPALAAHFEPIITQLGPVMTRRFQERQFSTVSTGGQNLDLVRRSGGVVGLKKIARINDDNGELAEVLAPKTQANLLDGIAAREAPGAQFRVTTVPITDVLDEPLTRWRMGFPDELRRAVAKVALEVVDEFERRDKHGLFSRDWQSLAGIQKFIRVGEPPVVTPLMVPLEDAMASAFAAANCGASSTLGTRVLVVYDAAKRHLFGLLSVAGTMPLYVVLADGDMGPQSWSLFVHRPLVPGDGERKWTQTAAISWAQMKWAMFSNATNEAYQFARAKYISAFSDALGRAIVHVDNNDDTAIKETLDEFLDSGRSPAGAITEALRLRFQDNGIPPEDWTAMETRLSSVTNEELLPVFRNELNGLCDAFGVPRTLIRLSQ